MKEIEAMDSINLQVLGGVLAMNELLKSMVGKSERVGRVSWQALEVFDPWKRFARPWSVHTPLRSSNMVLVRDVGGGPMRSSPR